MRFPQDKIKNGYYRPSSIIFIIPLFCLSVLFVSLESAVYAGPATPEAAVTNQAPSDPFSSDSLPKQSSGPVELNGDQVEYAMDGNKMTATGHVSIAQGTTKLTADKIEFSRDTKMAAAEGNVVLTSPQGVISGEKLTYNFDKMTGEFMEAKIITSPYYGSGESVAKVSENQITMTRGYITTCDLDKPHYKLTTKKVDIYPRDKIVARNVHMVIGNTGIFYLPKFSQRLDGKPRVTYIPGYDKQWGAFLLQSWRYELAPDVKGILHLDYREKKAFAFGTDLKYKIKNGGEGIIRNYYMNELTPARKNFWQNKTGKTVYMERFKAEWQHKWSVDDKTEVNLQYYKLSDVNFLKDYFKREYESDSSPQTFFLLTRNFTSGTMSFRVDDRVNRFTSIIERLPEVRYDISSQKVGNSGIYLRSQNAFANLSHKDASPTEVRRETMRLDTDNELSYPFKISFIEMRPYIGSRETYYSKTLDPANNNSVRQIFRTGADLSTKFYKVMDVKSNFLGMNINRLRHVITPSVAYLYTHRPTVLFSQLETFDSVDSLDRSHSIALSLENKLQTKRDNVSFDLLRFILSTDFRLKENPSKGGFDQVRSEIEFNPSEWLTFSSDSNYNTLNDKLTSANFEFTLKDPEKDRWSYSLGKRFSSDIDDQITTQLDYKINPKWKFSIYRRFDIMNNILKEQQYTITRDLHCWEMDINFNERSGEGSEIWFVFRLKAFPDMGLDFGTSFNKRKAGSQSSGSP